MNELEDEQEDGKEREKQRTDLAKPGLQQMILTCEMRFWRCPDHRTNSHPSQLASELYTSEPGRGKLNQLRILGFFLTC